jgi:D-hydroxyproline dehydrogenase subunit beta
MRRSSELPREAELVVVGSGIVGAATAFFAARAGLSVAVLERRPALCSMTTAVAAGGYRLQLEHREELALVSRTVRLLERFGEETGQSLHDPAIRRQGYLWLARTPETAARQRDLVERQRGWGVDGVELLSGDEARERFAWLPDDVVQARFRQNDGLIEPKRIAMGLLEGSGAEVLTGVGVTGFGVAGGRLTAVRTDRGVVAAGACVIAAGPLSELLAREAGIDLPVSAVRRQRVLLWDVPEVPRDAPMTIDEETTTHWRPVASGAYLLYPDAAEPGTEPVEDVPADPAFATRLLDPDSPIAVARTAGFWRDVWERAGSGWVVQAGQYTMTPDQRPLIGETEIAGLWVNTGYSGHGVMAGPAGGEILAELLTGGRSGSPFSLDREFVPATQAF